VRQASWPVFFVSPRQAGGLSHRLTLPSVHNRSRTCPPQYIQNLRTELRHGFGAERLLAPGRQPDEGHHVKKYASCAAAALAAPSIFTALLGRVSIRNRGLHVQPYCVLTHLRKALVTAGIAALAASIIVGIMNAPALKAQNQSSKTAAGPKFDVASVKPSVPSPPAAGGAGGRAGGFGGEGRCPKSFKMDRSRVDIECATLWTLIAYAFRFPPARVTGPDWIAGRGATRFNVAAKLPEAASEIQIPEMLQALLADRFKLALHRGTTEQPINALVVAKGGLKLKDAGSGAGVPAAAADPGTPPNAIELFGGVLTRMTEIPNADGSSYTATMSNPRMGTVRETDGPNRIQRWEAPGITLEGLADLLDRVVPLPSPVIDMTGLKGRYQLVLEVSLNDLLGLRPAMTSAVDDPTARENALMDMEEAALKGFNDGLRKLGLQLERRKGPVETLVVDRVEKTPAAN
jgi:uncharacterized protein (TIGR03435 family)